MQLKKEQAALRDAVDDEYNQKLDKILINNTEVDKENYLDDFAKIIMKRMFNIFFCAFLYLYVCRKIIDLIL